MYKKRRCVTVLKIKVKSKSTGVKMPYIKQMLVPESFQNQSKRNILQRLRNKTKNKTSEQKISSNQRYKSTKMIQNY